MKIATFNINNIKRRLPNLLDWLGAAEPDIVCLQELKATDTVPILPNALRTRGSIATCEARKTPATMGPFGQCCAARAKGRELQPTREVQHASSQTPRPAR
jgi:exonuclease III